MTSPQNDLPRIASRTALLLWWGIGLTLLVILVADLVFFSQTGRTFLPFEEIWQNNQPHFDGQFSRRLQLVVLLLVVVCIVGINAPRRFLFGGLWSSFQKLRVIFIASPRLPNDIRIVIIIYAVELMLRAVTVCVWIFYDIGYWLGFVRSDVAWGKFAGVSLIAGLFVVGGFYLLRGLAQAQHWAIYVCNLFHILLVISLIGGIVYLAQASIGVATDKNNWFGPLIVGMLVIYMVALFAMLAVALPLTIYWLCRTKAYLRAATAVAYQDAEVPAK